MAMTRERFARLLDPVVFRVYEQIVEKGEDIIPQIYGVNQSELAEEKITGIGATGLMQEWQGQVYYDDVQALWDKTFVHKKYSIGLKIERELWEDAKHPQVRDRVQRVTLSVHRTRQVHAHEIFNRAFDPTYPGPDGKPLCVPDHPLYPGDTGPGQSNVINLPLSLDALEEARLKMFNFTDDRGKKLLLVPDTLIVPPALEARAKELVYSEDRPDTADRATNVRRGAYRVVVLPLLEDSNNWFLADSQEMKRLFLWFERRKPVPERDEDFDTETLKWKYVARYSYGFIGWWCIVGSQVA